MPVAAINSGAAPATLSARQNNMEAGRSLPNSGAQDFDQQLLQNNVNAVSSALLVRQTNPGRMTQHE